MDLAAFRALVRRLTRGIPEEYLDGVAAVDVSPRTVPHPILADVFTLGECIPVHGQGETIASRIVLYHGSFRALAAMRPDFAWDDEAWETLTHELRHHLEWRAGTDALEAYDWAADQNFARLEGRPYDPLFFQAGEPVADGVFRVDDDVFIEQVVRTPPSEVPLAWRGARYIVPVPSGLTLPAFLVLDGVDDSPPGDLLLVLRRRPRLLDLFRRSRPCEQHVRVYPHGG